LYRNNCNNIGQLLYIVMLLQYIVLVLRTVLVLMD